MFPIQSIFGRDRWRPGDKPGDTHTVEFDPNSRLSKGLLSLLWFELCDNGAQIAGQLAGMRDFRSPHRGFALFGAGLSQVSIKSPFGGEAVSTSGTSTTDYVGDSNLASVTTTAAWTLSFLSRFDGIGSATYTGDLVIACNNAISVGVGIDGGTNKFSNFGAGGGDYGPAVTALSGWHRITCGEDGTTNRLLWVDGVLNDTEAGVQGAITQDIMVFGWPWPTADMFLWNGLLDSNMVLEHAKDPYGTTMRSRQPSQNIKGQLTVVGTKPGLLATGVGP